MASSVFEDERVRLFDWKVIVAVAIIYSMNAFLLEGASSLFPHEERVTIVVPAFASIVFGPVIGGLGTGFGNLLLDIIDKYVLSDEGLAARHVLGFFANMVGAMVVGLYSRRTVIGPDDRIFTWERILQAIRNTLASVLGLAVVTGVMIGYGRWLLSFAGLDTYTFEQGSTLAGIIVTSNGFVLLVAMVPLQLAFLWVERRRARTYRDQLEESRALSKVGGVRGAPVRVESFKEQGKGFVLRRWSTVRLKVRNLLDIPMRYRVEVLAQDHVDPNVFYTELMTPNGVDVIDLQVYPFDDAERVIRLVFRPWVESMDMLRDVFEDDRHFAYEYTYNVLLPGNRRFRVLVSIVGIMALIVAVAQAVRSMQDVATGVAASSGSLAFMVTVGVVVAELLFVFLWYQYRKRQEGVA